MLICKTKQRGFRVKKYKHGLYKFNNFFSSPSLSHNNNFTIAKSEHGLLPGSELEMSKNWNSSSGRFLANSVLAPHNRKQLYIGLVVGKVLRLLVAFIDTFLHNFDIYIDGTYISYKGEVPSREKPTRNTTYTTVVRAPTMADFVVEKYNGGVEKTISIYQNIS